MSICVCDKCKNKSSVIKRFFDFENKTIIVRHECSVCFYNKEKVYDTHGNTLRTTYGGE